MKKIGLHDYVYEFSIDYNAVPTAAIPQIYKYLITKNGIV